MWARLPSHADINKPSFPPSETVTAGFGGMPKTDANGGVKTGGCCQHEGRKDHTEKLSSFGKEVTGSALYPSRRPRKKTGPVSLVGADGQSLYLSMGLWVCISMLASLTSVKGFSREPGVGGTSAPSLGAISKIDVWTNKMAQ